MSQPILARESRTTHARAVVKALTWRGLGSIDTLLVSWWITGSLVLGGSIAVVEIVTKLVLYYGHERVWSMVTWGVKTPAAADAGKIKQSVTAG